MPVPRTGQLEPPRYRLPTTAYRLLTVARTCKPLYLRWCDQKGEVLLTSYERTALEAARADREAARAKREAARAKQEAMRADKLAAKLRELGIDPEQL